MPSGGPDALPEPIGRCVKPKGGVFGGFQMRLGSTLPYLDTKTPKNFSCAFMQCGIIAGQADVSALHHRPRISSFVCADDGRSSSRSETRVGYIIASGVLVLLPWPNELYRTRSRASRLS
jgi:hypothetical protein